MSSVEWDKPREREIEFKSSKGVIMNHQHQAITEMSYVHAQQTVALDNENYGT